MPEREQRDTVGSFVQDTAKQRQVFETECDIANGAGLLFDELIIWASGSLVAHTRDLDA